MQNSGCSCDFQTKKNQQVAFKQPILEFGLATAKDLVIAKLKTSQIQKQVAFKKPILKFGLVVAEIVITKLKPCQIKSRLK